MVNMPLLPLQFNFSYFSVFPFLIFATFFIKWLVSTPTTHKNLPPSPPKLPILGNLHQLGIYPHYSLQALARRYGSLMLLHFGSKPVLIVSSAETAREIMKTHDLIFSNRTKSSIAVKLLYDRKDISTAPYGEYWRKMRSICVLQLLSNKRVQSFRTVREEEVALLIKNIRESSSSSPVNLSEMFISLTNNVVCRVAFGRKYCGDAEGMKFKKMLGEFMQLLSCFDVGDYIPWLSWVNAVNGLDAKAENIAREFDKFLDVMVEEHLERQKRKSAEDGTADGEEAKDLVDVLLEMQKYNLAGFPIDRVNIKALILDMFSAGTDTSYTVLEWAMTELLRHPRVMRELQKEVRGIRNGKSGMSETDLEKMHYLKAVIKETLRLYPPIPILVPRESTQDVKIKGYNIAAGTMVITNAWAIGRDPATWEKPEEFWPERFLNSSIDFKGHDFQLIPFGAGRRGCPGIHFAMAINEIALANIVAKFDWALPGGARGKDLDMSQCTGVTIHRKVPLIAVPTPSSC